MLLFLSLQLLLQICGSKENYRLTRDIHALKSYMKVIVDTCQGVGFDPESSTAGSMGVPLNLGYRAMLGLIEQLKACAEVAATRTSNWQVYCQREKSKAPSHPSLSCDQFRRQRCTSVQTTVLISGLVKLWLYD